MVYFLRTSSVHFYSTKYHCAQRLRRFLWQSFVGTSECNSSHWTGVIEKYLRLEKKNIGVPILLGKTDEH